MKLGTYTVSQGDTIEVLARTLLGDSRKVSTITKINNLRYPYLSDDPMDQFANKKGASFLVGSYTNPSIITINNSNNVLILPSDTITLSEGVNFGSGIVQSVSGSVITLVAPIVGTFRAGSVMSIFTNQQNITTQVLRTGDTLLYPSDNTVVKAQNNYALILGTDWQLDQNGFLKRVNRDIGVIKGLSNLAQALKLRMQTEIGNLKLHPNYGNRLFSVLGESGSAYFSGLAKHYAAECCNQDPRVRSASVTKLIVTQDHLEFTLSIIPVGSQNAISQPISIRIGGA